MNTLLNKQETARQLVEQLIEMEKVREQEWKALQHQIHQSTKTVGNSSMLFHLNQLKELLQ